MNDSHLSIEEVNGMIDAIDSNNDNEIFNSLLNDAGLSRTDISNAEDINNKMRDVLVKYRQEKLSEYYELDIANYSQDKSRISAPYVAQMNALNIEFKDFLKHEIDDIKAVCNYNADNILQNNDNISANEFKKLLLSKVRDDTKRGNLNEVAVTIVITKFSENKFFR